MALLRTLGLIDIVGAAMLLVIALYLDGKTRLLVVIAAILIAIGGTAAWVAGSHRADGEP
jgi:hypothetical protein